MAILYTILSTYRTFFYAIIIFLSLLPASFVREAISMNHHTGTIHGFEYFFNNGFQFGKDFIDNVGPYGFLHYPIFYSGKSFYVRILSFSALVALFSFFGAAFLTRLKNPFVQILSLIYLVYFSFQDNFPLLSYEIIPRLIIFLSGIFLLDNVSKLSRRSLFLIIGISFFYAFISLQKTTNIYLVIFVLITISLYYFLNKKSFLSTILIILFFVFLLSLWVLAGQQISLLPHFYLSSILFSLSYQEAVNVISPQSEYICGFITISIIIGFVIARLIKSALVDKTTFKKEIFYSAIFSSSLFVVWKHGMISRNIHTGIYFNYIACIAPYLFFHRVDELKFEKPIFGQGRFHNSFSFMNLGIAFFLIVILLSFLLNPALMRTQPFNIYSEMTERLDTLLNYNFIAMKKKLDKDVANLIENNRIPERINKYIGNAKVDEYGYEPQLLLINNLNYRPRPIPINFIAVSSLFIELNKNYYSNIETAPEYIFAHISGALFYLHPAIQMSDSGAFIELLHKYRPIDRYQKWLILKRYDTSSTIKYEFLGDTVSNFNQDVDIPYAGRDLFWCKINIRYNLIGRLMKFLFKPAKIAIEYYDEDGERYEQPIIPMSADYGFLINPLINDNKSLLNFYQTNIKLSHINKIRIKYLHWFSKYCFKDEIEFKFYKINSIAPKPITSGGTSTS